MLVKLTEISLFEDGVFENGEVQINFSDRQLLMVRKPKDPFGKSYTQITFANGESVSVRESPKEIAAKMDSKPLPVMLKNLQGYEPTPKIEAKPKESVLEYDEVSDEMVTNIRRI